MDSPFTENSWLKKTRIERIYCTKIIPLPHTIPRGRYNITWRRHAFLETKKKEKKTRYIQQHITFLHLTLFILENWIDYTYLINHIRIQASCLDIKGVINPLYHQKWIIWCDLNKVKKKKTWPLWMINTQ